MKLFLNARKIMTSGSVLPEVICTRSLTSE